MNRSKPVVLEHAHIVALVGSTGDDLPGIVNDMFRGVVLSGLQVGVDEEVHGMQFVSMHVHFTGRVSEGDGLQVRINVFLPEPEAGEDVAWHVNGVSGGRSDRSIAAGGVKT